MCWLPPPPILQVTLRERDSTDQRRVTIQELLDYMEEQIDA